MGFEESRWYRRSPVLVQDAVVSAHGAVRAAQDRRLLPLVYDLMDSQWFSEDEFAELERQKLSRLIRHCYETVPYYREVMRERGLTSDDLRTPADLPKLPLLTKEIVRARANELLSERPPGGAAHWSTSAGTAGAPLSTLHDERSLAFEQAAIRRQSRIAGLPARCPRAVLRDHRVVPPEQSQPPFWRVDRPGRRLIMSTPHLSRKTTPAFIAALQRFRPRVLEARPSAAFFIAQEMLALGETVGLDCVLTGSEPVYPAHRKVIRKAFDCELFDAYRTSERASFAFECPEHTGLHLAPEYAVTEFIGDVDGLHEIVGTNLVNFAMPLLRFRTGDHVKPLGAGCPCGRKMPLLGPLEAQVGGSLRLPDGCFLPFSLVSHAFTGLGRVGKAQLVQERLDWLVVRLVPRGRFSGEDRERVVAGLRERLGGGVRIDIELVEEIEREENGKYRWVVSRVSEPAAAEALVA
jgi:phenylacetate-CoA ligase